MHRLISGLGWSLGLFMPLVGAMLYTVLCVYFDEPWFVADRRADGPEMRCPNRAGSGAGPRADRPLVITCALVHDVATGTALGDNRIGKTARVVSSTGYHLRGL